MVSPTQVVERTFLPIKVHKGRTIHCKHKYFPYFLAFCYVCTLLAVYAQSSVHLLALSMVERIELPASAEEEGKLRGNFAVKVCGLPQHNLVSSNTKTYTTLKINSMH